MSYTCDKLDFDIKLHLFYFIAINDKDYIKYDNDNIIKNYYSNNFIYKEKNKYSLNNDKYKNNPNGFYISKNNNITYYLIEKDSLREAYISEKMEIEQSIDTEMYIEYIKDIMIYDTFGYIFYNETKSNYDLKIKIPNKTRTKDKLGCRICNSNDFKKSDVKDYIKTITSNIIEYDKLNKVDLCNYIEFLLRYKNLNEDKIYYINIDNILLSDLILKQI